MSTNLTTSKQLSQKGVFHSLSRTDGAPEDVYRTLVELLGNLASRLEQVDENIARLDQRLKYDELQSRDAYSTAEVASILGKAPFTVREWCRLGRIVAYRAKSGRGPQADWRISSEELTRIRREGLLPIPKPASCRHT